MRPLAVLLTSTALLGLPAAAGARLVIEDVRAGFPAADRADDGAPAYFKAGQWVPLRVRVRADGASFPGSRLVVETLDSDDVPNRYSVPLKFLKEDESRTVLTYTRPGSLGAEIAVSVVGADGQVVRYPGKINAEPLEPGKQLYLALGAALPDLHQVLTGLDKDPKKQRTRYLTVATDGRALPDRWFGYAGVDLAVFATGDRAFLEAFARDPQRPRALAGWVRRGGRLVIGAERNRDQVAKMLEGWDPPLPPVLTGGSRPLPRLDGMVQFAEAQGKPFEPGPGEKDIPVARLQTHQLRSGPVEVLAEEDPETPLLVRLPYGLGSVTLLALDLDSGPFAAWDGRKEFWQRLVARVGPAAVLTPDANNDLATDLQKELEVFPDVRPVSFGWVAFLIFLLILVVGPLDYFLLSRVFRRLEWSWLTYPLVLAAVGVAAYLAAASGRGTEARVNKVDLIDVDQVTWPPRVLGTSWFTLFSPRIETYDLAVEPAGPRKGPRPSVMLTWMGRPEDFGLNSTGRRRAQGLFRGAYDYAPDATALTGVPLPFASTKSFTASWEAACPFAVTSTLKYDPANPDRLVGAVASNLPGELHDAVLFYGGKWYPFEHPLVPGRPAKLTEQVSQDFSQWQGPFVSRRVFDAPTFQVAPIVNNLLFHEKLNQGRNRRDQVLRRLDESWRLRDPNARDAPMQEAILYGRLPRSHGPLTQAAGEPGLAGRLHVKARGPVAGTRTQETFVRVFLPVPPLGAKPQADEP